MASVNKTTKGWTGKTDKKKEIMISNTLYVFNEGHQQMHLYAVKEDYCDVLNSNVIYKHKPER